MQRTYKHQIIARMETIEIEGAWKIKKYHGRAGYGWYTQRFNNSDFYWGRTLQQVSERLEITEAEVEAGQFGDMTKANDLEHAYNKKYYCE